MVSTLHGVVPWEIGLVAQVLHVLLDHCVHFFMEALVHGTALDKLYGDAVHRFPKARSDWSDSR